MTTIIFPQRRIRAADDEINRLVYKLYGLTEEEVRIVADL